MVVESAECLVNKGAVLGGIGGINSNADNLFEDEVSARVGEWLTNHMHPVFDGVNKAIKFLKDNCGYNQTDINLLGSYTSQVVDSLKMYGTEPEAIPEFPLPGLGVAIGIGISLGLVFYMKSKSKLFSGRFF